MSSSYYFDSLAPSWLAADPGYIAALRTHLLDRMALQGYQPTVLPVVTRAGGDVPAPVGMVLLRVSVTVEEFDVDMGDGNEPAAAPRPAPSSGERYESKPELIASGDVPRGHLLAQQVDPDTAHVVPLDDVIVHDFGPACPCGPTPRPEARPDGTYGWVVVHHSLDGREQHEPDYGAAGE